VAALAEGGSSMPALAVYQQRQPRGPHIAQCATRCGRADVAAQCRGAEQSEAYLGVPAAEHGSS